MAIDEGQGYRESTDIETQVPTANPPITKTSQATPLGPTPTQEKPLAKQEMDNIINKEAMDLLKDLSLGKSNSTRESCHEGVTREAESQVPQLLLTH